MRRGAQRRPSSGASSASMIRLGAVLLGEEALTVLREVGVRRVPGHDRAEARRAVLRVASADDEVLGC